MIRYVIVDDDQSVLNSVKAKIEKLPKDYGLQHVKSYNSSKKAFEEVNLANYDLLIVDYEMPVYNGIELAKKIASHKKIIFLTSTSNNEQKAINNLDVSGFLSKPFDIEDFLFIIKNKIIGKVKSLVNNQLITLHIGSNKDVRFRVDQVYYISTNKNINKERPDKNCVHIYGEQDEIIFKNVRITIGEISKELMNYDFKKLGQSTIVNMSHFKERDNNHIRLYNTKESFEVSSKEKKGFLAKLRAKFT